MTLDEKIKEFLKVTSDFGAGIGSGHGTGSGDVIKSFDKIDVFQIDGVDTMIYSVFGNAAHGTILNNDLTETNCYIVKSGDYFAHGETMHEAIEALQAKLFRDMPKEELIEKFLEATDEEKEYPARYFYDWHHKLTGSCELGRKKFADDHGYNLDEDYVTLHEFLVMTRNEYGGDTIQEIIEKVGEMQHD